MTPAMGGGAGSRGRPRAHFFTAPTLIPVFLTGMWCRYGFNNQELFSRALGRRGVRGSG